MYAFRRYEIRQAFFTNLEQLRRRLSGDKIDQPAAIVAMMQFSSRPFADHLYLFKLDHDLSLSLCSHRLTHRRVKILVSIYQLTVWSLPHRAFGNL